MVRLNNMKHQQHRRFLLSYSRLSDSDADSMNTDFITFYVFNPLESRGNYSVTSSNMKLVHWLPFMGGLLHLVQRGGDWAGP